MRQQKRISSPGNRIAIVLAILACTFGDTDTLIAQSDGVLEAKAIPTDASFLLSVRPKQLMVQKELEYLPLEMVSATIEENLGIPIDKVDRLDLVGSVNEMGFDISIVLQMESGFKESSLEESMFRGDWQSEDGVNIRRSKSQPSSALIRWKEGKYIFGDVSAAAKMMKGFEEGPLSEVASKVKGKELAIFLFAMEPYRTKFGEQVKQMGQFAPPGFANNLGFLVEDMKHTAVRWNVASGKIQFVITAEEDGSIDAIEDALVGLAIATGEQYMQIIPMMFGQDPEMAQVLMEYVERLNAGYADLWKPTKTKNRLLLEVSLTDPMLITSIVGLSTFSMGIAPMQMAFNGGPQPAMAAPRVMDPAANTIRELTLSILNHESAFKKFPPAASVNADDEPLLSWRVKVLPFLGENELYQKFHLDEPWDSEHNIKLLPLMPKIFQSSYDPLEPGLTPFVAVVGSECVFEEKVPRALRDIPDGLSNTIWLVVVDDEHAVPWTAPKDFNPDPENPGDGLRINEDNDTYVFGFCDGSVQSMSIAQVADLWAFFTRAGGEVAQIQPLSNE